MAVIDNELDSDVYLLGNRSAILLAEAKGEKKAVQCNDTFASKGEIVWRRRQKGGIPQLSQTRNPIRVHRVIKNSEFQRRSSSPFQGDIKNRKSVARIWCFCKINLKFLA